MPAKQSTKSKAKTKRTKKKRPHILIWARQHLALAIPAVFVLLVAIVGLATLLFSGAGSQQVIGESFSSSAANFTTVKGGKWAVTNGTYALTDAASPADPNLGNANVAVHKTSLAGDFTLTTDITVPDSTSSTYDDASVLFGWQDENNYLYASFNEKANDYTNGIFLIKNGEQSQLTAFTTTQTPGVKHSAIVTRKGNTYTVTLDGKVLGSATSTAFSGGRVGVGTRNNPASFDNFIVTIPTDATAPSTPTGLSSAGITGSQATIKWNASTDNVAVTGYNVFLNGAKVATTTSLTYTFTGLSAVKSYNFGVSAYDAVGNTSAQVSGSFTTTFIHPGILLDKTQLDYVKAKVAAGASPWAAAYTKTKTSKYAAATYTAKPVQYVGCGAGNKPDESCTQEMDDAIAAYTQAVLWYYTGQTAYAQKSIQIMDAWSATLKDHKFDMTTYTNGKLQAAWVGETFTRAAEIIRYSNAGWSSASITRFETMLKTAFLPHVINGWKGGNTNWLTSMADATMSIGVFTNDVATFNAGMNAWKTVVKSGIYMKSDGAEPVSPPSTTYTSAQKKSYWYNPTSYIDGLSQETCRDISHVIMGLDGLVYAAETARIQGYDLLSEHKTRIVAAYELQAKYLNQYLSGTTVTNWVCPGAPSTGGSVMYKLGFEKAYHAYANRLGVSMPNTKQLLGTLRPTPAALHMDWETLTTPGL